uniref:Uncharacterized protein n=1 Tax=Oryza rufipogon TaxID=4529 RepID=A0A0E0QS27_ORYRU
MLNLPPSLSPSPPPPPPLTSGKYLGSSGYSFVRLRKQPLGMSAGVQSMTPMTTNQTPWNTRLADRTRLTAKLLGQGIPSTVVASVTAITVCSSQWNCPSTPMWSAEWRWKMSSCCANAAAATSCDTASRMGALALSMWMVTAA